MLISSPVALPPSNPAMVGVNLGIARAAVDMPPTPSGRFVAFGACVALAHFMPLSCVDLAWVGTLPREDYAMRILHHRFPTARILEMCGSWAFVVSRDLQNRPLSAPLTIRLLRGALEAAHVLARLDPWEGLLYGVLDDAGAANGDMPAANGDTSAANGDTSVANGNAATARVSGSPAGLALAATGGAAVGGWLRPARLRALFQSGVSFWADPSLRPYLTEAPPLSALDRLEPAALACNCGQLGCADERTAIYRANLLAALNHGTSSSGAQRYAGWRRFAQYRDVYSRELALAVLAEDLGPPDAGSADDLLAPLHAYLLVPTRYAQFTHALGLRAAHRALTHLGGELVHEQLSSLALSSSGYVFGCSVGQIDWMSAGRELAIEFPAAPPRPAAAARAVAAAASGGALAADGDADVCALCLCELGPTGFTTLACGHRFHYMQPGCGIEIWHRRNRDCPLCRRSSEAPRQRYLVDIV